MRKRHDPEQIILKLREAERNLAQARTTDTAARAEVRTRAAALAFSTGDLARP